MPNFQLKLLLFAYFIIASLAQDTNETPKLTDVQSADQKVEVPSGTVSVSSPDQKQEIIPAPTFPQQNVQASQSGEQDDAQARLSQLNQAALKQDNQAQAQLLELQRREFEQLAARQKWERQRQVEIERQKAEILERARQAQRAQNPQSVSYDKDSKEDSTTRTQKRRQSERMNFALAIQRISPMIEYNEYMFQIETNQREFLVSLPVDQEVVFSMYCYITAGNTYIRVDDVDRERPLLIRVTENDKKLLHEETFFFQHIVIFEGKKSMVYQIIFENSGTNKLITMSFKAITENTHIANVITPQQVLSHSYRAKQLNKELSDKLIRCKHHWMIENRSRTALNNSLKHYFYYQMCELLILFLVGVALVMGVKHMVPGASIV